MAGNQIFQRLVAGRASRAHHAFVETALESDSESWILDAGCGSLALSGSAYLGAPRRATVLVDKSLTKLRWARRRLRGRRNSRAAAPLLLLQADVQDLPFRAGVFGTVLCMGMLHQVPDARRLLGELDRMLSRTGGLYIASLVAALSSSGHPLIPAAAGSGARSPEELAALLESSTKRPLMLHAEGDVAFGVAQHEG